MQLLLSFCGLLFVATNISAQEMYAIKATIERKHKGVAIDKQQKIYLYDDEGIYRYTINGEKIKEFKHTENSAITAIDFNPAGQMIVLFSENDLLLVLDKNFIEIGRIQLDRIGIEDARGCYFAPDGLISLYDLFNNKVVKLNVNGSLMQKEIVLYQDQVSEKSCSAIEESGPFIYLLDTSRGIVVYDVYGKQRHILGGPGIRSMQLIQDKVLYVENKELVIQSAETRQKNTVKGIDLPIDCDKVYWLGETIISSNGRQLYLFVKTKKKP